MADDRNGNITVQINGLSIKASLESASTTTILDSSVAEQLGIGPASPGVVSGDCWRWSGKSPVDAWIGTFDRFSIDNETVRNPTIYFADLWRHFVFGVYGETGAQWRKPTMPQLLLGGDFFRTHRMLFAYSQKRVYFTYAGGTVFPAHRGKTCSAAASNPK